MEMQQLRYVIALARTRNFSRASEQCHVSQPSLSQQIQKLEDELGERLFDRMKRETRLTAYGELFLARAVKILEEANAIKREANDAKSLLHGPLNVGVLPTIAPYLLPGLLAAFTEKFPGIEIVIHEDTTAQLLKQVLVYEVDLALASQPIQDERLEVRNLFSEELWLALPPNHPLARKRFIKADDIKRERLIVMKAGHCLGDQVLDFCDRNNTRTPISFRSAQLETVQALVRAGVGLSLIPEMAAMKGRPNAPEYRSFTTPKPERKIVAVWPRQRPLNRAANEFMKLILSVRTP
ncbi:MAG TPA: LysR substrate-binding domain-containing protein [Verrucomicrobiae bacterium]|jgi:LysR family hydrogen peroxide-inducible transcriptional activator|nr:LysR substrate-binding domain-containing protein [Verrucomicrobiae bacterium]